MFSEPVYTLEEVAEYLKVPSEVVLSEISKGLLDALTVGEFVRIRETALNAYLNMSVQKPRAVKQQSPTMRLAPASNFSHIWPDKKKCLRGNCTAFMRLGSVQMNLF